MSLDCFKITCVDHMPEKSKGGSGGKKVMAELGCICTLTRAAWMFPTAGSWTLWGNEQLWAHLCYDLEDLKGKTWKYILDAWGLRKEMQSSHLKDRAPTSSMEIYRKSSGTHIQGNHSVTSGRSSECKANLWWHRFSAFWLRPSAVYDGTSSVGPFPFLISSFPSSLRARSWLIS